MNSRRGLRYQSCPWDTDARERRAGLQRLSHFAPESVSSLRAVVGSRRDRLRAAIGLPSSPNAADIDGDRTQDPCTDGGIDERVESAADVADGVGHAGEDRIPNRDADVMVAIPAHNEQRTIESVIERADRYADTTIVVDDGSEDETATKARAAGARVIEHDRNRGYGAALQTAFWEAADRSVDHLIILDGDDQHDPEDIPKLVAEQQETGAEVVIGSRFVADTDTQLPLYRRFGLIVINILANVSIGVTRSDSRIADTQSGFRSYTGRAVRTLATDWTISDHMGASIDILHAAREQNYRIEEVKTTVRYDVEESSNHNPIRHGIVLVGNILEILRNHRPGFFYGSLLACSTFVALTIWLLSRRSDE